MSGGTDRADADRRPCELAIRPVASQAMIYVLWRKWFLYADRVKGIIIAIYSSKTNTLTDSVTWLTIGVRGCTGLETDLSTWCTNVLWRGVTVRCDENVLSSLRSSFCTFYKYIDLAARRELSCRLSLCRAQSAANWRACCLQKCWKFPYSERGRHVHWGKKHWIIALTTLIEILFVIFEHFVN